MEKPGISAYNKLKGPVMEFGYVTESGDKVRVRSMPADGLDPITIQKHLKYVEQEYVDEAFGVNLAKAAGYEMRKIGSHIHQGIFDAGAPPEARSELAKHYEAARAQLSAKGRAAFQRSGAHSAIKDVGGGLEGLKLPVHAARAAGRAWSQKAKELNSKRQTAVAEDTTYTRREFRKTRLLEAIRKYGDTDA